MRKFVILIVSFILFVGLIISGFISLEKRISNLETETSSIRSLAEHLLFADGPFILETSGLKREDFESEEKYKEALDSYYEGVYNERVNSVWKSTNK